MRCYSRQLVREFAPDKHALGSLHSVVEKSDIRHNSATAVIDRRRRPEELLANAAVVEVVPEVFPASDIVLADIVLRCRGVRVVE